MTCVVNVSTYITSIYHLYLMSLFSHLSVNRVEVKLDDAREAIAISADRFESEKLLERLARSRVDAHYNAPNTPDPCLKGTRVALLDDLIRRVTDLTDPASRVTVVCGTAGTGKSTVAKSVAQHLAESNSLAASFFFSRDDAARSNLDHVFTTIAVQLAKYNAAYRKALVEILPEYLESGALGPEDQLKQLIIGPFLRIALPPGKPAIVLLDAIDESGPDRGGRLLKLLSDHLDQLPPGLRFFLTGRPEHPFVSKLPGPVLQAVTHITYLHKMPLSVVSKDIHLYMTQALEQALDGTFVDQHDISTFVEQADGLFVYAATIVRYIVGRAERHSPQASVDLLLHQDFGRGTHPLSALHQLYYTVLSTAVPSDDPEFCERYRKVLGAILHVREPLAVQPLVSLLGMGIPDVQLVIQNLSSVLLQSTGSDGSAIRINHLSFREYVTGTMLQDSGRGDLFIDPSVHHQHLANRSIAIMRSDLHRNMCGLSLRETYMFDANVPDLAKRATASISIYLHYACRNWAYHLLEARKAETGNYTDLEDWVETGLLSWIEVLSINGELELSMPMLKAAQVCLSLCFSGHSCMADIEFYAGMGRILIRWRSTHCGHHKIYSHLLFHHIQGGRSYLLLGTAIYTERPITENLWSSPGKQCTYHPWGPTRMAFHILGLSNW